MKIYKYELPEDQFERLPAVLQEVLDAVKTTRLFEKGTPKKEDADKAVEEAIRQLAGKVKENEDLRLRVISFLYWYFQSTVKIAWLLKAFNFTSAVALCKAIPGFTIPVSCPRCRASYTIPVRNRGDYELRQQSLDRHGDAEEYYCSDCKKQRQKEREEEWRKKEVKRLHELAEKQARLQETLANIQNMTYEEYLQSTVWKEIRARAKREVRYTCQNCGTKDYRLWVHHTNILATWGQEKSTDLLVLCFNCHNQMYERRQKRKTEQLPSGEDKEQKCYDPN